MATDSKIHYLLNQCYRQMVLRLCCKNMFVFISSAMCQQLRLMSIETWKSLLELIATSIIPNHNPNSQQANEQVYRDQTNISINNAEPL